MKISLRSAVSIALAAITIVASPAPGQIPNHFSYQGLILEDGAPYTGEARLAFALVDTISDQVYWSNDGTLGIPESDVSLQVNQGIFSVLIGDETMHRLRPEDLDDFTANQALRVWVDLGGGRVLLGDQPISSALFAQRAFYADNAVGTFTARDQIWAKAGGFKFPDNTIQVTAATGGGGGAGTLDEAYDGGGAGAGRVIIADSGDVDINGGGGLTVMGGGAIGVNTSISRAPIHIGGGLWNPTTTYGDFMIGNDLYRFGVGTTLQGPTAGEIRLRSVGGVDRLLLGGGAYDVLKVDPDGIEIMQGPFRVMSSGRLEVDGDFGALENNAAISGRNTNPSGVSLSAENSSTSPTVIIRQWGGGDMLTGYDGNILKLQIQDTGHTVLPSLEVTDGDFKVASNGQVSLIGDFGTFEAGTALRTENTNAYGIALWAETAGASPTVIVDQHGTGEIIVGYQAGAPVFKVMNDGKVVTPSLQITGGADLAEPFAVAETSAPVLPGSVMVIDPDNSGQLSLSRKPYDPRVAGIISGAGGVKPGLTLSQDGITDGDHHVALTGRVYVLATIDNGEIRPGDLMTTSSRPGVAMRATDRERAFGAVVGKAMTSLEADEGLVLVLVGLQ